jgi:formylglycine-generating enzyme required for sulfatase activity
MNNTISHKYSFLSRTSLLLLLVIVFTLPGLAFAQTSNDQPKYAVVIGNAEYEGLSSLANPVNDARDMAAALERLGFQVTLAVNADLLEMEDAVVLMGDRLSRNPEAIGLFYYAGHGIQSQGSNYLLPSRTRINSESFLRSRALSIQAVLDTMNAASNQLNVIILDACRDNPFSWARSASRGLSVVGVQPPGSMVVYATSAGSTAADGTGRNGLFTGELLKHLETPGIDLNEVFFRTGAGVREASNGAQIPAVYNQFFDRAYLNPSNGETIVTGNTSSNSPGSLGPNQNPLQDLNPQYLRASFGAPEWENSINQEFIRVNEGVFIMGLDDGRSDENGPSRPVGLSPYYISKYEVTVGQFRQFVEETGYVTIAELYNEANVYTEGYWQGKSDANWDNPYMEQGEDHPVVYISWLDTIEFCNWLSQKEGLEPAYIIDIEDVELVEGANGYRLPTEAEWEFAAKGGEGIEGAAIEDGVPVIPAGINPDPPSFPGHRRAAAVAWYVQNSDERTHPVGSKRPNSLGLYDMSGNAIELVWDYFGYYPDRPQLNPTGPNRGDSRENRIVRGGGFLGPETSIRTTDRGKVPFDFVSMTIGFRIAIPIQE